VSRDEDVEVVRQRVVVRRSERGDVLGLREVAERDPSREDDVDEHEHAMLRQRHVDAAGGVRDSAVVEQQPLTADHELQRVVEGRGRHRTAWPRVAIEQRRRVTVAHERGVDREEVRGTAVVEVRVGVDDMGHRLVRDARDRVQVALTQCGRCVDGDHAVVGHDEHRLVDNQHRLLVHTKTHTQQRLSKSWGAQPVRGGDSGVTCTRAGPGL
jgi:hypothetical protein